jgi:hypothetical protein
MRALAAGVVALGVAVTGCSTDAATRSTSAPVPSASTSVPTATPADVDGGTADDVAQAARAPAPLGGDNDRSGRQAFAEYVLQAWIYSLNTNDASPLLDASGPTPCDGCRDLAAELRTRAEAGWHVLLGDVRVSSVTQQTSGRDATVALSVAIPESTSQHADGSYRGSNPAHPRSTFTVAMRHTGDGFRLTSFSLS